ncbi:MAG: TonB family protein [Acidobacteria bacterium]|nr:TonB family protein [Acidobacteriota bacterium]
MVQKPNRVPAISDLQVGPAPVFSFRLPQLPVPAANISPVQMPAPAPEQGELPASALPGGDPMNLIALMRTPAPPTLGYLLEAGNRLAESQPGTAAGPAGENGAGGQPGLGSENLPPLKGTHGDMLQATGMAFDPMGLLGSGSPMKDVALPPPAAPSATQPAAGGNLGVIIVQQNSQESVLEGGDVLSGQPVYTVYFDQPVYTVYFDVPGAPRRWILQYCVPGGAAPQSFVAAEGVIRILPRRSVQPPFPLSRIPLDVNGVQSEARRLVVYATVSETGEIADLRVVRGAGQPLDTDAVETLRKWVFRPATRGDAPVAVEALFGIPLM